MRKVLFSLFLFASFISQGQIINTIAGNGTSGYTGDGGQATAATLNGPNGIAVDTGGNIYISESANNIVRKISNLGIITTIAGNGSAGYSSDGGPASAATLNYPIKLSLDDTGNIYVAEYSSNRIRKISINGVISTFAGTGNQGFSGDGGQATAAELNHPTDIIFDHSGNAYIADYTNYRIRKISSTGIITTIAGNGTGGFSGDNGPATDAEMNCGFGIALDANDNVYLADASNNRIRKISTSGIITTIAGSGPAYFNGGSFSGDGGPATNATLSNCSGLSVDGLGNIYVADDYNNRIRKISSTGIITTIAGNGIQGYSGDGSAAIGAELYNPGEVALDKTGNIYFTDDLNNRVRKFANTTGVSNLVPENYSIKVFPVPFNNNVVVESTVNIKTIEIVNTFGQNVYKGSPYSKNVTINLVGQSPGAYFIKINDSYKKKIIKE